MTSRKSIDGESLHWLFHENSKDFEISDPVGHDGATPESWKGIDYKRYETQTRVALSTTAYKSSVSSTPGVREVLAKRRSQPIDTSEQPPISIADLSVIIGEGAGITTSGKADDDQYRSYPSGGAQYPLEVYVSVLNGADIDEGLYHFDVRANELELLRTENVVSELDFLWKDVRETISVVVFVTAELSRTTRKYGERGYRYANLEAGHLMQNVCLLAETRDLSCRPYGGFIENRADAYLRLRNVPETTLYVGLIGGDDNA